MFGLLDGLAAVALALMILAAAVVGGILWLVASWLPALSGPLYALTFALTGLTVPVGIMVLVDTLSRASPPVDSTFTVGIPASCGFLVLATWGTGKIHATRKVTRRRGDRPQA